MLKANILGREPVWPSGKAGKQRDPGSNPVRLSFLFNSCGLWTLLYDCHSSRNLKRELSSFFLTSTETIMLIRDR